MTDDYQVERRTLLQACREYRYRYKQAARLANGASVDTRPEWLARQLDWFKRLKAEQRLLAALRYRGLVGYRQQIINEWNTREV